MKRGGGKCEDGKIEDCSLCSGQLREGGERKQKTVLHSRVNWEKEFPAYTSDLVRMLSAAMSQTELRALLSLRPYSKPQILCQPAWKAVGNTESHL